MTDRVDEEKSCEDSKVEVELQPTPSNVLRLQLSYETANQETTWLHLIPDDADIVHGKQSRSFGPDNLNASGN